MDTKKKPHDSGILCIFIEKPPYNGTNDRDEVRRMSKIIFNEIQIKQLENNKYENYFFRRKHNQVSIHYQRWMRELKRCL